MTPHRFSPALVALATIATLACASTASAEAPPAKPKVQIALLLDTSGSMSGLIAQAKTRLWKIVNEFSEAKRDGARPLVEVALYEYGKSSIAREDGFIRRIVPLTTDLDSISEALFALRTNGGDEFCGEVIQRATRELKWSKSDRDLKMIFIAGNESFAQGKVSYRTAIQAADAAGITVNTIHCGTERDGINGKWRDGATISDGMFLTIDHNHRVAHIPSPHDAEIEKLGAELNKTYVRYGARGKVAAARQEAQDSNASASAGSMTQRSLTKASANYRNSSWDLVDAVAEKKVDLAKLDAKALPEKLRKMSVAERKAYVAKTSAARKTLQKRIRELNTKRQKHVAAVRAAQAKKEGKKTLDSAIGGAIRAQAKKKGFKL